MGLGRGQFNTTSYRQFTLTAALGLDDAEELEDALAVLDDVVLQHGRGELGLRPGGLGGRRGHGRRGGSGGGRLAAAADEAVGARREPLQLGQGLPQLERASRLVRAPC